MRYSDIYVGLKVRANCKEEHERNPRYYPRKGTKGVVTAIDTAGVWVLWKKVQLFLMQLGQYIMTL